MQINCPHCGFSREMPDEKIPGRSELATCPKCGEKFRFRSLASDEFRFAEADDLAPEAAPDSARGDTQADAPKFYGPDAQLHAKPKPGPIPLRDGKQAMPDVLPPFEDLEHFGFFPGIIESIKRAMLAPRLFFEVMPLKGLARPLVFALLLFEFYLILGLFWSFTGLPEFSSLVPGMTMLDGDASAGAANPIVLFVFMPLLFVLELFLSSALLHGVLTLLRAAPRGFEATFRATAYSYAPLVLSILPYGYVAGMLWSLPLSVIGCAAIHRTQTWRVVLALVLVAGFVGILYFSSGQLPTPGALQ